MANAAIEPAAKLERRSVSLTDQAYQLLRERIISGDMPPGCEVSEPELAAEFCMSKTPVREALARLCVEGLMDSYPRRGYRVTPVTLKDMNDLFAVRGTIEAMAAALAAENMTDAERDALADLAHTGQDADQRGGLRGLIEANLEFHAAIAAGSRNQRLAHLVTNHLDQCTRLFFMGARVRDVKGETDADHARLVEAIRGRDPAAAHAAMLAHNEHTHRGLLNALLTAGAKGLTL